MRHSRIDRLRQQRGYALCRHLSVAHFGFVRLPVVAGNANSSGQVPVIWAIGTLADGQSEQLGIWRQQSEADVTWLQVLGDLWIRGVEWIEWATTAGVSGPASDHLSPRLRIDTWHSADLPPSSAGASPGRRGTLVSSVERIARTTQTHLAQSVLRHGSFESDEAAIAFVVARLEHVDSFAARCR